MGDLLAADFKNKKYLGKVETVQQAHEVSMAEIEREIATALWGGCPSECVPPLFAIPIFFAAPDKEPA